MDLALPAPLQTLPWGAGLFAVIKAAFAALKREDLTPEQRAHAARVWEISDTFGSYILEAENREDLLARVDTLIEDPAVHEALREAFGGQRRNAGELDKLPTVTSPGEDYHESFGEALGPAAVPHLRELHRHMLTLVAYLKELQQREPPPQRKPKKPREKPAEAPSSEGADPLGFLSDPSIPVPMARALLGGVRCLVFTLAACAAAVHPVESWLGAAIAERWSQEAREMLALFESLLSTDTAQALNDRVKAIREAYAHFNADAERSGDPVYPSTS
ncbi:MAG TPA: hypothetical protein VF815_21615 [Myxococcaceae bacterium]|jgi:hypothetical protein